MAQAVEMEVSAFIAAHADLEDDLGRRRVVRHGHHRERQVQTGIGPVALRCPRVRDRGSAGEAGKIRFTSAILPPYLRRAKSIEELLPWLYLKGISTGDFICSSESVTGVAAAIEAGIAIGVLDQSALTPNLAVLSEAEGLAEMPASKLVLEYGKGADDIACRAMAAAIKRAFAAATK